MLDLESILARYRRLSAFRPAAFTPMQNLASDLKIYDVSRPRTFYHSGDFGDIIYSLPTIRALGGGILYIGPELKLPFKVKTRQVFTQAVFDVLAPLLRLQPYLQAVEYAPVMPEVDYDLNLFRRYFTVEEELRRKGEPRLNLAEAHLWTFKLPLEECASPWLVIDREVKTTPVLIHRSPRWRNEEFPWMRVLKEHGRHASFVGLESEYEDFVKATGVRLPYLRTSTFLELARYIAASELFVGNQSAPYAIAEGMKKNTLQEVWLQGPNCLFTRDNASYGDSKFVYIPALKRTMTQEIVPCPLCESRAARVVRNRADIVECLGCGVVYLRTRPSRESMVARYQAYADGDSHMRLPTLVDEIRGSGLRREYFMQALLSFLKPGSPEGALLDIGCGWGAFLTNAREKGFKPVGVEICQKMAGFAETVLGLTVYTGQVEDLGLAPETFRVVTAIHVLEHLPRPSVALATVHRCLSERGLFCGIVPNFNSKCSQNQKDKWAWLDPEMHYTHFTPWTLRQQLERHGFSVLALYTHTGDFDSKSVAETLREESNVPLAPAEIGARIAELEADDLGEEIRFFAQKA